MCVPIATCWPPGLRPHAEPASIAVDACASVPPRRRDGRALVRRTAMRRRHRAVVSRHAGARPARSRARRARRWDRGRTPARSPCPPAAGSVLDVARREQRERVGEAACAVNAMWSMTPARSCSRGRPPMTCRIARRPHTATRRETRGRDAGRRRARRIARRTRPSRHVVGEDVKWFIPVAAIVASRALVRDVRHI